MIQGKTSVLLCILLFITALPSCNPAQAETMKGCTDPLALNFDPDARVNDGSCTYEITKVKPSQSLELPSLLEESSGIIYWDGKLWSHNDSEDPHLYSLDTGSAEILEQIEIPGVINIQWEDISQDDEYLYLGDFGNNLGNRRDLHILRVEKASLRSESPRIDTIFFSFEDQEDFSERPQMNDHDCEAMTMVDGKIILFTKEWLSAGTTVHILEPVPGTQSTRIQGRYHVEGLITGATSSTDGKLIILCGYTSLVQPFLLILDDFPEDDYFGGNKRKIQLQLPYHQVEGIAWTSSGQIFLSNESFDSGFLPKTPQKLHRLSLTNF